MICCSGITTTPLQPEPEPKNADLNAQNSHVPKQIPSQSFRLFDVDEHDNPEKQPRFGPSGPPLPYSNDALGDAPSKIAIT